MFLLVYFVFPRYPFDVGAIFQQLDSSCEVAINLVLAFFRGIVGTI